MKTTTQEGTMSNPTTTYYTEIVWVGSAGHLMRYKVVDANGKYVPGGLFRTEAEAEEFIKERQSK